MKKNLFLLAFDEERIDLKCTELGFAWIDLSQVGKCFKGGKRRRLSWSTSVSILCPNYENVDRWFSQPEVAESSCRRNRWYQTDRFHDDQVQRPPRCNSRSRRCQSTRICYLPPICTRARRQNYHSILARVWGRGKLPTATTTLLTNCDKAIQIRVKGEDKGLDSRPKTKEEDIIVDIHRILPLVI